VKTLAVRINLLSDERGEWLPRGWNTPEQGGFDGRWQQIFPDERLLDCQEQQRED